VSELPLTTPSEFYLPLGDIKQNGVSLASARKNGGKNFLDFKENKN
jgi:hypothetical protein